MSSLKKDLVLGGLSLITTTAGGVTSSLALKRANENQYIVKNYNPSPKNSNGEREKFLLSEEENTKLREENKLQEEKITFKEFENTTLRLERSILLEKLLRLRSELEQLQGERGALLEKLSVAERETILEKSKNRKNNPSFSYK